MFVRHFTGVKDFAIIDVLFTSDLRFVASSVASGNFCDPGSLELPCEHQEDVIQAPRLRFCSKVLRPRGPGQRGCPHSNGRVGEGHDTGSVLTVTEFLMFGMWASSVLWLYLTEHHRAESADHEQVPAEGCASWTTAEPNIPTVPCSSTIALRRQIHVQSLAAALEPWLLPRKYAADSNTCLLMINQTRANIGGTTS